MSLEAKLQTVTGDYQKLQAELSKAVESRQKLDAQKGENESVKKEFDILGPHNTVFKLIGPVLVKQDQEEAKANVAKRLEFIGNEIKRVEGQIKDISEKLETKKLEIVELQTAYTQLQQQQQAGPAGPPDANSMVSAAV